MLPRSMYATHSDGLVHIWRNKVAVLCSGASRYSMHICSRCSEHSVQAPPFLGGGQAQGTHTLTTDNSENKHSKLLKLFMSYNCREITDSLPLEKCFLF